MIGADLGVCSSWSWPTRLPLTPARSGPHQHQHHRFRFYLYLLLHTESNLISQCDECTKGLMHLCLLFKKVSKFSYKRLFFFFLLMSQSAAVFMRHIWRWCRPAQPDSSFTWQHVFASHVGLASNPFPTRFAGPKPSWPITGDSRPVCPIACRGSWNTMPTHWSESGRARREVVEILEKCINIFLARKRAAQTYLMFLLH